MPSIWQSASATAVSSHACSPSTPHPTHRLETGAITITQASSAAADIDSATPSAANTVVAGTSVISLTVGGTYDAARAWAEKNGLSVDFPDDFPDDFPSWWYPNCTMLTVYTKAIAGAYQSKADQYGCRT